jgi:hypothetical protein
MLRMESSSEIDWKEKCDRIASLAAELGLTSRFYSDTVLVVCSPEQNNGETAKDSGRERPGGDPPSHGEGGPGRQGSVEGTLL